MINVVLAVVLKEGDGFLADGRSNSNLKVQNALLVIPGVVRSCQNLKTNPRRLGKRTRLADFIKADF